MNVKELARTIERELKLPSGMEIDSVSQCFHCMPERLFIELTLKLDWKPHPGMKPGNWLVYSRGLWVISDGEPTWNATVGWIFAADSQRSVFMLDGWTPPELPEEIKNLENDLDLSWPGSKRRVPGNDPRCAGCPRRRSRSRLRNSRVRTRLHQQQAGTKATNKPMAEPNEVKHDPPPGLRPGVWYWIDTTDRWCVTNHEPVWIESAECWISTGGDKIEYLPPANIYNWMPPLVSVRRAKFQVPDPKSFTDSSRGVISDER